MKVEKSLNRYVKILFKVSSLKTMREVNKMAKVRIPDQIRNLTKNERVVDAKGDNVREIIEDLEKNYPGIKERILDKDELRKYINIFVEQEDIRFLNRTDPLSVPVGKNDEISILPAMAGGRV